MTTLFSHGDPSPVALAQALVRMPSLTGHEAEVARYIQRFYEHAGFQCLVDDTNTVIAWMRFGPGPVVLMDGHIDTVPADPEAWSVPPFEGVVREGFLIGRGASDMKGAVAAMMCAAHRLATGTRALTGTLVLTGTSWEEPLEGYTLSRAFGTLEAHGIRPDVVIIGEASQLNLKRGQRGRARVIVDVSGRPAHSAHPEAGLNAVYQATRFIEKVRAQVPAQHPDLGAGIRELIGIHSLPYPADSVVPSSCRITYDLRLLPGETAESVLAEFERLIAACRSEDPDFQAELSLSRERVVHTDGTEEFVTILPPAWVFPESHPVVQTALDALRGIGQQPRVLTYDFCTNGSFSAGIAGVPTIGYGPGEESMAHVVDERVRVSDLVGAAAGYEAIAYALLSP